MPKQQIYYEYVNEELVPYWFVLTFQTCEINWNEAVIYLEIAPPFEFIERDEFDDSIISTSLFITDLVMNASQEGKIGIQLNPVKERIERHGLDPDLVEQFIIPIPDINEVLHLLPNTRKINFTMEEV